MKESIVILAGGGPAPGINTVEGTIAKAFMAEGYRVLGLHGGYSGLFSASPNFIEFNFALADAIFNRGGSYLQMSRYLLVFCSLMFGLVILRSNIRLIFSLLGPNPIFVFM